MAFSRYALLELYLVVENLDLYEMNFKCDLSVMKPNSWAHAHRFLRGPAFNRRSPGLLWQYIRGLS